MKTDVEIASEACMEPIQAAASKLGFTPDDLHLYGKYAAKIPLDVLKRFDSRPNGKLVLVTAITATKAGEGKTVTSIGLIEALGRLGVKVAGGLREPSMGPVFGIKGGATGGGYAQVYPMWDINLHFTGDIHAASAAHNLLSAMVENHLAKGNELQIDPTRVTWKKTMDTNCRELRNIVVGLGGKSTGGIPRESGFIITSASEISAILALANSVSDLRKRLGEIVVAYDIRGKPVTAEQIGCVGAMMLILKDAINPNLVQTLEGDPVYIHGFPFANIAHGNSSVISTKYGLKTAVVLVTEGGFAADLGAEKFFDIVCRQAGFRPDCAVVVASVRAIKLHDALGEESLERGFANLDKHVENIKKFGVPPVVAINRFSIDTDEEIEAVRKHCGELGVPCAISEVFAKGGEGGNELAQAVMKVLEEGKADFHTLYEDSLTIKEKIHKVATEIYGASGVRYVGTAERDIKSIEQSGKGNLPVCVAKTQLSISDNPALKGAPTGWELEVREVALSAGAGFIVPICGTIMLIPGLPTDPAAKHIDYTDDGKIIGLS